MTSNSELYLDIETDGLNPSVIWIAVTKQDGEVRKHYDAESLAATLEGTFPVVGQNLYGFDLPVLERLWGIKVDRERIQDTLVMSRLSSPNREGGHSLRAWGERLGFSKGDHTDWSCLSPEMEKYCVRDVEVTEKLYQHLLKELDGFDVSSIELEHEVQRITARQVRLGWLLDLKYAHQLLALLKEKKYELEDKVQDTFRPLPTFIKEVTPRCKKDHTLSAVGLKFLGEQWSDVCGPFSRVDYPEFNLGSRQQIGRYLQHFGWKPTKFTEKGHAIVDESVLSKITDIPEAQLIAEYLMVQKRVAQIKSWIDAAGDDGRVHGRVNTNGAVTGRMTHSEPNLAQVPAIRAPYGKECRSCWTVPEGYSLVGFDASGLELRMLAHYMGDKEYTNEILHGDIHTANQRLAGLESRDQAKTFIYAFLYGAGDAKLGTIVGGNARTGSALRARFLNGLPALRDLTERVAAKAGAGYLKGLDGRQLQVRSAHSALNTLLQGAGAIVMKKALVILDEYAQGYKLDYNFVGNIHDEVQAEVAQGQEDKYGRLAVSCIEAAGLHYNLRCPLTGEYSVGRNWSETH
jgi:DNA polymerase-1